jgi:hypothetical protein
LQANFLHRGDPVEYTVAELKDGRPVAFPILAQGDSWIVPKGTARTYRIIEPFSAVKPLVPRHRFLLAVRHSQT